MFVIYFEQEINERAQKLWIQYLLLKYLNKKYLKKNIQTKRKYKYSKSSYL